MQLMSYTLSTEAKGAVLICPGGGYGHLSEREGEPIAKALNAHGYHAYVLHYSIAPTAFPEPLVDVAKAMAEVKSQLDVLKIPVNQFAVMGFSAGGHVAGSLGVHWDKEFLHEAAEVTAEAIKPDAMILCYPVIAYGEHSHEGSFINLIGETPSEELIEMTSLERNVSDKTPPTFLWHTVDDQSVPVENALMFMTALQKEKVPYEAHIYPEGVHGLALATEATATEPKQINDHVSSWFGLAMRWLDRAFGL